MASPQVTFYILHGQSPQTYSQFVGQLADKIWHQGYRIYIHTASLADAEQLDAQLWTFRPDSFVAHVLQTAQLATLPASIPTPIYISHTRPIRTDFEILINLSTNIPSFAEQFQRILEVVADDDMARQQGRERYRHYRQQGWQLDMHDIYR